MQLMAFRFRLKRVKRSALLANPVLENQLPAWQSWVYTKVLGQLSMAKSI